MTLNQKINYAKPLAAVGLLSGAAALILIVVIRDTFSLPGSAEYLTYEIFNRIMAVLLALQTCAWIAFLMVQREALGKFNRRLLMLALGAWAMMAVGTAAEFWLYSDLPYPNSPADFNMRTLAFAMFFFASLIAGMALLVLGLRLAESGTLHRLFVTVLVLYLPLFIVSFFAGLSIFTDPALASIMIAGLVLKRR